jgi:hypothetical protein
MNKQDFLTPGLVELHHNEISNSDAHGSSVPIRTSESFTDTSTFGTRTVYGYQEENTCASVW